MEYLLHVCLFLFLFWEYDVLFCQTMCSDGFLDKVSVSKIC